MTTWTPDNPRSGIQPILSKSLAATPNHPIGTVVSAYDPTLGDAEFIYLPGVTSTAVGSLVTWNPIDKTTTLVPSTAKLGYPVAVAMAANTSSSTYAWYQISGVALILKDTVAISKTSKLAVSATAKVSGASTAGKTVCNAVAVNSTVSATTWAKVLIMRPFMENIAT